MPSRRGAPPPTPPRPAASTSRQRRVHLPEHARREPPLREPHGALDAPARRRPMWTTTAERRPTTSTSPGANRPASTDGQRAGRRQRTVGRREQVVGAVRAQPRPPSSSTASRTRVRQPSGPPGSSSPVDRASITPREPASCSRTTCRLQPAAAPRCRRAAGRSRRTVRRPAYGHGGAPGPVRRRVPRRRRPAGSALASSATRARTRSPGSAWRTNTTRPSCRADAVPAVRDRPDVQLDHPSDGDSAAGQSPPRAPRRTSPADRPVGIRPVLLVRSDDSAATAPTSP